LGVIESAIDLSDTFISEVIVNKIKPMWNHQLITNTSYMTSHK
ncbi:22814_t:CDS:2, partial [Gigaspora margarita]